MSESMFKVGQPVKVRAEALNGFKAEYQPKINRDRVGIVRENPIWGPRGADICVRFPRDGRRPEMILERFKASDLVLA